MNRFGDTLLHNGSNRELLHALAHFGVNFILIGGLAVAWYCSDRQVDDADLLINPSAQNSKRTVAALRSLNLHCFDDNAFSRPSVHAPLKQMHYADLLTPQEGGMTFEEAAADTVEGKLFETPVRIAAPRVLLALIKQALARADRDIAKYLADIECLESQDAQLAGRH